MRLLILLFLLFNSTLALSETEDKVFKNKITENVLDNFFSSYNLIGKATYKFLLLDIYDAKLISETEKYPSDKFALILEYNRDFKKESVIEETIKQLKIQRKYSDNELVELKQFLDKIFRPIKKNDHFIAMKLKDKGIFYFKDEKVLETKDIGFLNLFFNIWLREDSEDPNFTKSLLGKDK